jgi:hypothetical protein
VRDEEKEKREKIKAKLMRSAGGAFIPTLDDILAVKNKLKKI